MIYKELGAALITVIEQKAHGMDAVNRDFSQVVEQEGIPVRTGKKVQMAH